MQYRLAKRLPIPIATSSLIQVPSILAVLPPTKSIGILSYDAERLGYEHLEQLGVSSLSHHRIHFFGAPQGGHLQRLVQSGSSSSPTGKESIPYVHADLETELIERSKELLSAHRDIGALVLECTQMPPFAEAIQKALGGEILVYDVFTMASWFYSGIHRRSPYWWRT